MSDYPPGMTLRPIEAWPGTLTTSRRAAPFSANHRHTLTVLDRELRLLDPKDRHYPPTVLQIAMREQDFRIDGMPRANAQPTHPGVILSIDPRNKPPMSFPCDTFMRWQDNLRGIALGMEALRKLERYGIITNDQQYRGWQALEAAPSVDGKAAAESFLREFAGHEIGEVPTMANVIRRARGKAHPDRNDGDQKLWDQVQQAAKVLGLGGAS